MSAPAKRSMLCTDADGLCLAATGDFPEESAGIYHNLIQMASQLSAVGEHAPVIRIETDDGSTLVKTYDAYTVAVQLPVTGDNKDKETAKDTDANPVVADDDTNTDPDQQGS